MGLRLDFCPVTSRESLGDFFFSALEAQVQDKLKWETNWKERNLNRVQVPGPRREDQPCLKSASAADQLGGLG